MPIPIDAASRWPSDEPTPGSPPSPGPRPTGLWGHPSTKFHWAIPVAVGVALLMIVGAWAVPGTLARPSGAPSAAGAATPSAAVASVATHTTLAQSSAAVAGTCLGTGNRGDSPAKASSPTTPRGTLPTGSSPLFNSQVTPYAVYTGPYGYVAKGAALRDQGYGQVNLTWPGGSTSNLVAAYMIWSILNDSVPPAYGTINGVNVTGTWTAYATPSPCWSPTYIYTFIADVTPDVINGINNLTSFPSGVTSGADPWSASTIAPLDDSCSLVAIFDNASSSQIHQVTVYTGASPVGTPAPNYEDAQLNYSTTNSTLAKTTYIVADGQLPGNSAVWNGTTIDANAFPGSDPHESTAIWSYGNLSDTKSYLVNVTLGSNSTTAEIVSGGSDCFTWVGQVLSVGVAATKGPYAVDFQEQGLLDGASWSITTHSTTKTGTVANGTGTIGFSLGNGTYTYSAGAIPGYTGPSAAGYSVNGGPVYIRVIFHQLVYPVTFNETGLPAYQNWWVQVTNASQGILENLTTTTPLGDLASLANGTYNYTTGEIGLYLASPPAGTFVVHGGAVTVLVDFVPPPLYPVTFVENGLPSGTSWGGGTNTNFGYYYNATVNASFTLELPNASAYSDDIVPTSIPGYSAPYTIYFVVAGAPVTVDINFTELFTVQLVETGLPLDTYWYATLVNLTASVYLGSYTPYLNFSVANSSYNFTVEPVWDYTATPANGSLTVAGANVSVAIVFSLAPMYTLTFAESGLAAGALWAVEVDLPNATLVLQNTTSATINFEEANGSYYFTVLVTGYTASPSYGYFDIVGENLTVTINFTKVWSVTFDESGLPSGTYWYVYLYDEYVASYSSAAVAWVANGSYDFTTYTIGAYTPSISGGTVNVSGTDQVVSIVYSSTTAPTVSVTFVETGLPSLSNWSVDLNYWSESSTSTTINFTEPNGTFDFEVGAFAGYSATPGDGIVTVAGMPVTQTIAFAPSSAEYEVEFVESNLPSGTTWYVNVSGEPSLMATLPGSSSTSLALELEDGTYSFVAASNNASWTTTASGSFTVDGYNLEIAVPFTSPSVREYEVQFTETGLPSGSTWYVNVTGEPGLTATVSGSSGTTLSIDLSNATYSYVAATGAKDWTTPSPKSFTVDGLALNVSVPFSSTAPYPYAVTFTETGLPIGVSWYVNITGQPGLSATVTASSGTQLVAELNNGSYDFTAASNSKNWTTSAGGPFSVAGAPVAISVKFGAPGGSSTNSGGLGSYWLWIVIAAIVAALLVLILLAGRRRKKQPPTPTPAPGSTSGLGPAGGPASEASPPPNP